MNINSRTVLAIMLFSLFFMVIGWFAPAMWAAHAPADNYIEVHSFETADASVGQENHIACFDRTVKHDVTGTVFTELYLVNESGERIEVTSQSDEQLFEDGRTTIRVDVTLPEEVKTGTYYYERAHKMTLAQGRVERTFTYRSDRFRITNSLTASSISC